MERRGSSSLRHEIDVDEEEGEILVDDAKGKGKGKGKEVSLSVQAVLNVCLTSNNTHSTI